MRFLRVLEIMKNKQIETRANTRDTKEDGNKMEIDEDGEKYAKCSRRIMAFGKNHQLGCLPKTRMSVVLQHPTF